MPLNYDMIPRATYCQPQIGSFGYTEEQAKERGYNVKVAKFPFAANGKAWGLGEGVGFVKIVADARYNEILGAHMIGPDVTELLPELTTREIDALIADGTISGCMITKIAGALDAAKSGVHAVHIIDGRVAHAMLL